VSSSERLYRASVRALSIAFIAIGVVVLARTFAGGGGPDSFGVVLGVLFVLIGAGRLWIASRIDR
jgi:hypothetical protein